MIYVDTSVLIALLLPEPMTRAVEEWFGKRKEEVTSAIWCVTEFASALGIKERTRQITAQQSALAWAQFEVLCRNELNLVPVDPATFHRAALLTRDSNSRLRSGDALHLASALESKTRTIATLDIVMAENARKEKMKVVQLDA